MLLLDNAHRLIDTCELFYGSVNSADVHSREIVKLALSQNASAVIFYHNNPTHSLEPSSADKRLTRKLTDALALIDVRVLDHFVVTVSGCMLVCACLVRLNIKRLRLNKCNLCNITSD